MHWGLAVVLFVIWLAASSYLQLDSLDRWALRCVARYGQRRDAPSSFSWKVALKFLLHPLTPTSRFNPITVDTEGTIYNFYLLGLDEALAHRMESKLFWEQVFVRRGIRHPRTLYRCYNGVKTVVGEAKPGRGRIWKPDLGSNGVGVRELGPDETVDCSQGDGWIIQEMLIDCHSEVVRHFRVVTLYDGSLFIIHEMRARDKYKTTSNMHTGGEASTCVSNVCQSLAPSERRELQEMTSALGEAHRDEFGKKVFSIGWDVMLNCEGNGTTRAYAIEGNQIHGTWLPPQAYTRKIHEDYKHKLRNFLEKRNIWNSL